LRIGAVVADKNLDFLSQSAAVGVAVLDRLLDSVLELRAEGGAAAGDRSGDPQLDLRRSAVRESEAEAEDQTKREPVFHGVHLSIGAGKARLESRARAVLGVSAAGVSSRRRQRNSPARSWIHL